MKEYNRKKRKWEEVDKPVNDLKKPDTCRGKKPHDFVLLIPKYISKDHNLSKDEIEEYYRIEDERVCVENELDARLEAIGIPTNSRLKRGRTRFYKCSVCGKEEYKYNE